MSGEIGEQISSIAIDKVLELGQLEGKMTIDWENEALAYPGNSRFYPGTCSMTEGVVPILAKISDGSSMGDKLLANETEFYLRTSRLPQGIFIPHNIANPKVLYMLDMRSAGYQECEGAEIMKAHITTLTLGETRGFAVDMLERLGLLFYCARQARCTMNDILGKNAKGIWWKKSLSGRYDFRFFDFGLVKFEDGSKIRTNIKSLLLYDSRREVAGLIPVIFPFISVEADHIRVDDEILDEIGLSGALTRVWRDEYNYADSALSLWTEFEGLMNRYREIEGKNSK